MLCFKSFTTTATAPKLNGDHTAVCNLAWHMVVCMHAFKSAKIYQIRAGSRRALWPTRRSAAADALSLSQKIRSHLPYGQEISHERLPQARNIPSSSRMRAISSPQFLPSSNHACMLSFARFSYRVSLDSSSESLKGLWTREDRAVMAFETTQAVT